MLKHRTTFIILFIAAALLLPACAKTQPPDTAEPPPPDSVTKPATLPEEPALIPEDDEPALPAPVTGENSLVWRVSPTLEYDKIYYCGLFGVFSTEDHSGYTIDSKTGLTAEPTDYGHGGEDTSYFYDEKKQLYVYYSGGHGGDYLFSGPENDFNDFLDSKEWLSKRLQAFRKIDSDKIKKFTPETYDLLTTYYLGDANIGEKYALAYGTTFVTDFIYDYAYETEFFCAKAHNIIAVQLDGNWGVIDKDGNTAAPFCFEDILLIDDETAFAKYNGKYGILDVQETALSVMPALAGGSMARPAKNSAEYTTTENVNLRKGPGTDSEKITTVPKGTALKVVDFKDSDWYMVEYAGQTGYLKSEFLVQGTDTLKKETSVDHITINGVDYSTSITGLTLNSNYLLVDGDIASLQHMTNLTRLYLYGSFSDLMGLAGLTNLTELVMYCHGVSDLTPLAGLTNLTTLRMYGDQISDLTPLAGLKNLTELVVGYDRINDLTPLSGLENLISLTVWSHQISDWSPVEHVPNVTGYNY